MAWHHGRLAENCNITSRAPVEESAPLGQKENVEQTDVELRKPSVSQSAAVAGNNLNPARL